MRCRRRSCPCTAGSAPSPPPVWYQAVPGWYQGSTVDGWAQRRCAHGQPPAHMRTDECTPRPRLRRAPAPRPRRTCAPCFHQPTAVWLSCVPARRRGHGARGRGQQKVSLQPLLTLLSLAAGAACVLPAAPSAPTTASPQDHNAPIDPIPPTRVHEAVLVDVVGQVGVGGAAAPGKLQHHHARRADGLAQRVHVCGAQGAGRRGCVVGWRGRRRPSALHPIQHITPSRHHAVTPSRASQQRHAPGATAPTSSARPGSRLQPANQQPRPPPAGTHRA